MENNNKVKTIFYINKDDKESIKIQSDLLQIKSSQFIRNAVLEKLGKPTFEVEIQNQDTQRYISELVKIGINLNQIARKLNSNVKFSIADQRTVLSSIENINNHIVEIKSKL